MTARVSGDPGGLRELRIARLRANCIVERAAEFGNDDPVSTEFARMVVAALDWYLALTPEATAPGKTGSICACGAAKSYHGSRAPGRGIPDHEFEPRYVTPEATAPDPVLREAEALGYRRFCKVGRVSLERIG